MSVTFADPRWLWLIAVVPLVWLAAAITRSTFSVPQRVLQAALRSLILVLLAAALAQPVLAVTHARTVVVYLVDVSHSIATRAIEQAADRIDELTAAIAPGRVRLLTFDADAAPVAGTGALRAAAHAAPSDRGGRTDIQRALERAAGEFRPGESPRIVVFTDGRDTQGNAEAAAASLAARGVPVFVEPLGVKDLGDTWVDAMEVPAAWPAEAPVTLSVDVVSQRDAGPAAITVRDGDRAIGAARVNLARGLTRVPVTATLTAAGSHVITASIEVPGDPLAVNDRLAREVIVQPAVRVLYVDGTPERGGFLAQALTGAGLRVTVRPPSALPVTPAGFAGWDAVIVSDVARASIAPAAMTALTTFVEAEGGGLLFAGGDQVFGDVRDAPTGYRGTAIERLLPVTIERRDEPDVALVMVLDKSWSMAGAVMELCKSAAQAAVDALDDRQAVGVLSFDDRFQWDVTPRAVGPNRAAIRRAIAAIQPGGDTLIFPALEQAYLELRKVRANAKHVVLLSDGRSYPDDYEGLVTRMAAAGMTVSSIAVGREADAQLLSKIAAWGRGRSYVVLNAAEVPKIFVKEAQAAMPAFDEGEGIVPVIKARSLLASVPLAGMPPLRGRTAMVLKDSATEILASPKGEPLLAWWPIGRGRTAAFAADVKNRWGRDWINWSGYGPLFATLVRAIARPAPAPMAVDVRSTILDAGRQALRVVVEARDAAGEYRNLVRPSVRVTAADGTRADLGTHQIGPGRYEAAVTTAAGEPIVVDVSDSAPGPGSGPLTVTRHLVPDPEAEYRLRPPDEDRLRGMAVAGGGVYRPSAAQIRQASARTLPERRALWPWLALAAAVLWPVDVLLRRIRLFEAVSELT